MTLGNRGLEIDENARNENKTSPRRQVGGGRELFLLFFWYCLIVFWVHDQPKSLNVTQRCLELLLAASGS